MEETEEQQVLRAGVRQILLVEVNTAHRFTADQVSRLFAFVDRLPPGVQFHPTFPQGLIRAFLKAEELESKNENKELQEPSPEGS